MTDAPAAGAATATDRVDLPGRPTDIVVGEDLRAGLWRAVTAHVPGARRCGVIADEHVLSLWPLPPAPDGLHVVLHPVPRGERAKERAVLAAAQDALIHLRRDEPVLVQGGGAALDLGGLVAATVRRGLPWIALPTSVIGMADAAVGGKTAVNHPRGKNLIGTFHPPRLVLADVATLATLPARDRISGLAEVYKSARIGDTDLLARLRAGAPADAASWTASLAAAIAVKARLVEADERDHAERRLLNYGHTVGHALETVLGGEAVRHGEAVAIGMVAAGRIARARGLWSADDEARQRADLRGLGLPVDLPPAVDLYAVLAALGLDKKRRAGRLHTMVLPTPRAARVCEDVTDAEIEAALRSTG